MGRIVFGSVIFFFLAFAGLQWRRRGCDEVYLRAKRLEQELAKNSWLETDGGGFRVVDRLMCEEGCQGWYLERLDEKYPPSLEEMDARFKANETLTKACHDYISSLPFSLRIK